MAPFDRSVILVPTSLRGVAYQHPLLSTREDAIIDHLVKRVAGERRTPDSLPMVLVVYSADRGIILSGYQVSSLDRTGIPQEAL